MVTILYLNVQSQLGIIIVTQSLSTSRTLLFKVNNNKSKMDQIRCINILKCNFFSESETYKY